MPDVIVGFVGLGNMGSILAANLVASGFEVVAHDVRGPERNPDGATFATDVTEVAAGSDVMVLSLPDGDVSRQVCETVTACDVRRVAHVVDTSTIGVEAARRIDRLLSEAGLGYVDAPVSGGLAGARARTLSIMVAGAETACGAVEVVLAGMSDVRRRVGEQPGMAQALKLANNFLSATALAATSEAVAFGLSVGLDMETMLDVLNVSSGQSAATSDKFVNHVLTGRYDSGFANSLMAKDLGLYLRATGNQRTPSVVGQVTATVWKRFADAEPGVDFTRIFPFVEGSGPSG